ncbi:AAA family ATPase [Polaribacter porphyrae]|uniref:ATPase AAA-type core domain-containing protein n=1 Tax=Polaribacter porphyrae TaxID=1137780 RepID=A0A2S7WT33_9FLAO|nr:ATP-binding protein [Polaribacter porphyrae]PQJ80753.1 hypothetical protein BTO18_16940 [Polaribacter porphyrae]
MIRNITGPPVEGKDFFGREKELIFAWNHIQKGNSLILSAPRRVGKSSLAKKILNKAKRKDWNVLEINLEEIKTEEGFVKIFVEKITSQSWWSKLKDDSNKKVSQILESLKPTVEFEGVKTSFEWKSNKADVYDQLKKLLNHNKETLIMVDELTVLLNSFIENDTEKGRKDVEFFLNWLRSFRQTSGTKIRWIFCSSIGIDNFLSQYNLSYTFNDVKPYQIDEFKNETAKNLIIELSKSDNISLPDDTINYMLNKIGWLLPYFIQVLYSEFLQLIQVDEKPTSTKTIDEAYGKLISQRYLNTWEERLKEYNLYENYARKLLKKLSENKKGASRKTIFSYLNTNINDTDKTEEIVSKLLYMLKNDGYLIEIKSKYAFRSPLLRDFWFNRFVK